MPGSDLEQKPDGRPAGLGRVVVLGAGRLGLHLAIQLRALQDTRVHLWNRRKLAGRRLALAQYSVPGASPADLSSGNLPEEALRQASLVLLTVSDRAIQPLGEALAARVSDLTAPVFHCSGALSPAVLSALRDRGTPIGSIHPVRSFTLDMHPASLEGTWFALEGTDRAMEAGRRLVQALGGRTVAVNTAHKMAYHAAATMASNLVVALLDLAVETLGKGVAGDVSEKTRLEILLPLLEGTVRNLKEVGLPGALTGPVSRGDLDVVRGHLRELVRHSQSTAPPCRPDSAEVYRLLSLGAVSLASRQGIAPSIAAGLWDELVAPAGRTEYPQVDSRDGQPSGERS